MPERALNKHKLKLKVLPINDSADSDQQDGLMGMVYDCGPCPYLADREFHALVPVDDMQGHYRQLMDHGFRRNGPMIYRPHCENCHACSATRVDIHRFTASRSQKRCDKRNEDLHCSAIAHERCPERDQLFAEYELQVHQRSDADLSTLCEQNDHPISYHTIELHARDSSGRLLAVSIIDIFADSISSVYCYFNPHERKRSLGTYMALKEIEYCRHKNLGWLYLGYYVEECQKLSYKAKFEPLQIFDGENWVWYQQKQKNN